MEIRHLFLFLFFWACLCGSCLELDFQRGLLGGLFLVFLGLVYLTGS